MNVKKTFINTIRVHNLFNEKDRVLVALSGGADSVALLMLLNEFAAELDISLAAAHINHKLRETADRDMEFCKALCERLQIKFHSLSADVSTEAKKAGLSQELYARNLRYEFFSSLGYDKIATAHNKNDNAETLLFRFIRGTGIDGLSGIPYQRDNIIRPILDISKKEILKFCKQNDIEFVTDETNFKPLYSRNKLRLSVIPEIEKNFNPAFCDVVTQNSVLMAEDSEYLAQLAKKEYAGKIELSSFIKLEMPIQRRLLQLHYKEVTGLKDNLSFRYIEDILSLIRKNKTGNRISLPENYEAVIIYNELKIQKKKAKSSFKYKIEPETLLNIPEIGKNIIIYKSTQGNIYLDDVNDLYIKSREIGDYFYPEGMNGKKKLSDFFTDNKIPVDLRDTIPILTKGNEIVSIIGMRTDKRFCERSKTAYAIDIKEAENAE